MADWKENNERIRIGRLNRKSGPVCDVCNHELVGYLIGLFCPKCGAAYDPRT